MAFAKAKLTRFNEIPNNTPAPGSYNPKDPKFHTAAGSENGSPTGSVVSDKGSLKSINSTPCFRTPVLPVRRRLLSQSARKAITPKVLSQQARAQNEELQEKIVECINKTETIKDLESQIEDLKDQIASLRQQAQESSNEQNTQSLKEHLQLTSELIEEKSKLEEEVSYLHNHYQMEIRKLEEIIKEKKEQILELEYKTNLQIRELFEQKETLIFEYEEKRLHLDSLLLESQENLYDLQKENEELIAYNSELQLKVKNKNLLRCKMIKQHKRLQKLSQKLKNKTKIVNYLQKRLIALRNQQCDLKLESQEQIKTLQQEIINLEMSKKKTIEETEFGFLEVITDLRKKNEKLIRDHEKEINQHREQTAINLRRAEENANEQIRHLKIQLEDTIVQNDLDRKNLNLMLSDTNRDLCYALDCKQKLIAEVAQKKNVINELQRKLSSTIVELNDLRENYAKEFSKLKNELDSSRNEVRRYRIALDETHATVNVLKKRLSESDQGVEQLKAELNKLEQSKLKLENDNYNLKQKLSTFSQELAVSQQMILDEVTIEVNKKNQLLIEQVDIYKNKALKAIEDYEKCEKIFQQNLNEMEHKYLTVKKKYEELAQMKLSQMQSQNDKLQSNNCELLQELKLRDCKLIEAQSLINATKIEMEHQETENTELRFKVNRLETQLCSLQKITSDKSKMDKLIEENRKLKNDLNNIEKLPKYQELLDKYKALNNKINADKKEKQDLENKIRSQNKLIEKLKSTPSPKTSKKNSKLFVVSTDKENQSPGKAGILRPIESPNTTPLKERNC